MNRLLKKIREFGLVFSIESVDKDEIIKASKALKKAHIPVVLFPYDSKDTVDRVQISNNNEDMFIGAYAQCLHSEVKNAFASGCHFAFTRPENREEYERSIQSGLDLYLSIESNEDLLKAQSLNPQALLFGSEMKIPQMKPLFPFFVEAPLDDEQITTWKKDDFFIATIIPYNPNGKDEEQITFEASTLIRKMLGIRYSQLTISEDSPRLNEAKTFCALSAIPLIQKGNKDLLELEVEDMDRTISYLKWQNIYMDPFSAVMEGEKVKSTDLYDTFLDWPVRIREV